MNEFAGSFWPTARQELLLNLSNYATIQLRDELARLQGVGDITYLGQRDYSMRVWLDPEKLAVKKISPADVLQTRGMGLALWFWT